MAQEVAARNSEASAPKQTLPVTIKPHIPMHGDVTAGLTSAGSALGSHHWQASQGTALAHDDKTGLPGWSG